MSEDSETGEEQESSVSQTYLMDEDLRETRELAEGLLGEVEKVVMGKRPVLELVMTGILAGGNILFEDNPGLAKTLLVSSLAETMSLGFKRIQFTPDLMPSDITGTELLQEDPETHQRRFKFQKGPVFTNLLLADEINRASPRTQSALLEAMSESQATIEGQRHGHQM